MSSRQTCGPPAYKKALKAYTNGESPDQFAQPRVGSRPSLLVLYSSTRFLYYRRTAKILTRLCGCAGWSVPSPIDNVIMSLFSAACPLYVCHVQRFGLASNAAYPKRTLAIQGYLFTLYNDDTVSRKRMPGSDCAHAQADLGLRCPYKLRKHIVTGRSSHEIIT